MKRLRLRAKFVLLLSIVSLAPLALTALLTFARFETTLEQDAAKFGHQLSATAVAEIKSFIISQVRILDTIATVYNPEFSTDFETVEKIIENILYRSGEFTDITIVDRNGREIVRQNRNLVITPNDLRDVGDTAAFKAVKEKSIYVGPMYIEGGKPLFNLGRWMVDSRGVFSGAVFAQIDAKIMPQVMRKISVIAGPGGRVYMVSEKGIVIAHPDLSYILREDDLSNLPPIANIVARSPDIATSKTYYNENGEYVLGSAHHVRIELLDLKLPEPLQINWFVITEQQVAAVFADAYWFRIFSVLIFLLVTASAVAVAVFFARRISAPVEALYIAALQFKKGNLAYRTGLNTNNEMGDLARSFDAMAGTLENSIKHLKEQEKIISAERNQLRIILSGITNAVIAVDLQRNIILFNKAAEALTGLDTRKVMGKPIQEAIRIFDDSGELPANEYCPVTQDYFEGIVFNKKNLKFTNSHGQEHYINIVSSTIREGMSIRLGCILMFQDTTREFVMEKIKSEFVSIAAHQLRTPLTGIKWSLQYLFSGETGKLNSGQKEMAGDALAATNRMVELINDLLDVSRIEEGRFGIRLQRQSISPVLERVVNTSQNTADKKGITLKVEAPSKLPFLNIDMEKMEIALNNLVDNAIKYTLPGKTVELKATSADGELTITVKDEGIGIPRSEFDRVFTKFFRSNQAQLYHTSGTGLGLYVSKNIIEQHGGKIWFYSEENKGTTFYVSLPLAP